MLYAEVELHCYVKWIRHEGRGHNYKGQGHERRIWSSCMARAGTRPMHQVSSRAGTRSLHQVSSKAMSAALTFQAPDRQYDSALLCGSCITLPLPFQAMHEIQWEPQCAHNKDAVHERRMPCTRLQHLHKVSSRAPQLPACQHGAGVSDMRRYMYQYCTRVEHMGRHA